MIYQTIFQDFLKGEHSVIVHNVQHVIMMIINQ